jgi:hypothetical protein
MNANLALIAALAVTCVSTAADADNADRIQCRLPAHSFSDSWLPTARCARQTHVVAPGMAQPRRGLLENHRGLARIAPRRELDDQACPLCVLGRRRLFEAALMPHPEPNGLFGIGHPQPGRQRMPGVGFKARDLLLHPVDPAAQPQFMSRSPCRRRVARTEVVAPAIAGRDRRPCGAGPGPALDGAGFKAGVVDQVDPVDVRLFPGGFRSRLVSKVVPGGLGRLIRWERTDVRPGACGDAGQRDACVEGRGIRTRQEVVPIRIRVPGIGSVKVVDHDGIVWQAAVPSATPQSVGCDTAGAAPVRRATAPAAPNDPAPHSSTPRILRWKREPQPVHALRSSEWLFNGPDHGASPGVANPWIPRRGAAVLPSDSHCSLWSKRRS